MNTQVNESSALSLSPVLGKFLLFSVFPNHSAPDTYTAQTFTVNSESRTVRLSGAVTVTSNFGNTSTKNRKKTILAHYQMAGPPKMKEKMRILSVLVTDGTGL